MKKYLEVEIVEDNIEGVERPRGIYYNEGAKDLGIVILENALPMTYYGVEAKVWDRRPLVEADPLEVIMIKGQPKTPDLPISKPDLVTTSTLLKAIAIILSPDDVITHLKLEIERLEQALAVHEEPF